MLLIVAATENEIKPMRQFLADAGHVEVLVSGMGPVAAAACLSGYLARHGARINAVLNIGVAGAYDESGLTVLDICLAQQEFLGDFGICMQDGIEDFEPGFPNPYAPLLFDADLAARIENIFKNRGIACKNVKSVTVNCCSGTAERGEFLRDKFTAACENMEGAAVAMVCRNFTIPCAELRCISNMVENRNTSNWKLPDAIEKLCRISEVLINDLDQDAPPRVKILPR